LKNLTFYLNLENKGMALLSKFDRNTVIYLYCIGIWRPYIKNQKFTVIDKNKKIKY